IAYLTSLTHALNDLISAQNKLVAEIDRASGASGQGENTSERSRTTDALNDLLAAAEGLRIQPVPSGMRQVDEMLDKAGDEARLAADAYMSSLDGSGMQWMLPVLQRLDRMSKLIVQARSLVRT
ncbi:MAG TPA: hypothetical protein VKU60_08560, partial [Chloroflexota bacterium]|nr:hypothetical protein [Chloroflexota bacterium]